MAQSGGLAGRARGTQRAYLHCIGRAGRQRCERMPLYLDTGVVLKELLSPIEALAIGAGLRCDTEVVAHRQRKELVA